MDDPISYLGSKQRKTEYRPARERVKDYRDVAVPRPADQSQDQGGRCIDCGLPFCHWACPIGNHIPDWNSTLRDGLWEEAYRQLAATNNLPEITGRVCPAPCEPACVLVLGWEPVTIRENELVIIEHAFEHGFIRPHPPQRRTGKSVAVVGSGPAGLCCADQLNQAGHRVVVFERDDKIGGLLRYGVPDFKLEKWVIDRRLKIWETEGIEFRTGVEVGVSEPIAQLRKTFDAVCLAGGSRAPRDLAIQGRDLGGIHFAMEYLVQSNRRVAGEEIPKSASIDAKGKRVVVIGGGDTGSDCIGTANRQGAKEVVQLEILPRPQEHRQPADPRLDPPPVLKTSTSHEEGCRREWVVQTKTFLGAKGSVRKLSCVRVEWVKTDSASRPVPREIPGTAFEVEADLVLLALGFVSPEQHEWMEKLGLARDARGNIQTDAGYMTSMEGIFSAGDMRRGQSLIVTAIAEGRRAAYHIDQHLMGVSKLPLL